MKRIYRKDFQKSNVFLKVSAFFSWGRLLGAPIFLLFLLSSCAHQRESSRGNEAISLASNAKAPLEMAKKEGKAQRSGEHSGSSASSSVWRKKFDRGFYH